MKKLSILFTMVFAVSLAFAQNTAVVNQEGNSNTGYVDQNGSGQEIYLDQIGDDNTSTVDQDGIGNEGYVAQGMVEGYFWSPSTAMKGNRNKSTFIQNGEENYGEIVQVGNDNITSVNQQGNNNEAYSYQGWPFGFWGETAITAALKTTNGVVNIKQLTSNNFAASWTYGGNNNKTTISQSIGEENLASVSQGFIYLDAPYDFSSPVYNVKDNIATILQAGASNIGKVMQLGNANNFKLTQNGDGNSVGYSASASGLLESRNAYFEQDGNRNTFTGTQNDGAELLSTSRQTGDDNVVTLIQNASDVAEIIQDGDWNIATVKQYGGGQDAYVGQFGNGNTATVTQQ
ncbi:hypothetical protein SLH46_09905 [Draconibacterium sp. IB214405]|uniref:hypothetical protein n=1 Tax=Draconibacterium sp. IB214405 TaxID=3097352 RepID=UPI002A0F7B3B|nr:hypothetical protein [Draconibacterium sp. IB214405]MDX8339496.1 hypothetical protein [Draconibacterium sp. IB214405]